MRGKSLLLVLVSVVIIFSYFLYSFLLYREKTGKFGLGLTDQTYTYSSETEGYSISIPKGWRVHEVEMPPDELEFLSQTMQTSNLKAFINVSTFHQVSLSNSVLFNYSQNYKNGFDQLMEISNQGIKVGNYDGFLLEYAFRDELIVTGEFSYHCYDWILPSNEGYIFTFCVENNLWEYAEPMFDQMIQSIQLH